MRSRAWIREGGVRRPGSGAWGKTALLERQLVDTSVLEETKENKKMFKIVMFDSQESSVNRSQGLKKEKEETFKNLSLVAAQCNDIATCAYS